MLEEQGSKDNRGSIFSIVEIMKNKPTSISLADCSVTNISVVDCEKNNVGWGKIKDNTWALQTSEWITCFSIVWYHITRLSFEPRGIEWPCLIISLVCVLWSTLSSWILIYRKWQIEERMRIRTAGETRVLVRMVQAHEGSDAFEMY